MASTSALRAFGSASESAMMRAALAWSGTEPSLIPGNQPSAASTLNQASGQTLEQILIQRAYAEKLQMLQMEEQRKQQAEMFDQADKDRRFGLDERKFGAEVSDREADNTLAGIMTDGDLRRHMAGLLDRTGRVLGLMPHPERALFRVHHPDWSGGTADTSSLGGGEGDGAILFRNAVEHLKG